MIPFAVSTASEYADIYMKGEDSKHVYWAMAAVVALIVIWLWNMCAKKWYLHVSYKVMLRGGLIGLAVAAGIAWYGSAVAVDESRAQTLKNNISVKYQEIHPSTKELKPYMDQYLIGEGGDIEIIGDSGQKFILKATGENEPTIVAHTDEGSPAPVTRAEAAAAEAGK